VSSTPRKIAVVATMLACAGGALWCVRCAKRQMWPGPSVESPVPPGARVTGPVVTGTLDVTERPPGPHPRILLTPERLAQLAAAKKAKTDGWKKLEEHCDKSIAETIEAGYEVWDWGNAALSLALCFKAGGKVEYQTAAVKYFVAMLDDRHKVGDKKGGANVVAHDQGYPIRTHGWLGAIAYDWLHDAPGMTPEVKKKFADRITSWTAWFKKEGYQREVPIANYYAGYFGAVAFGGLAIEGEDERAKELRLRTQQMWNREVVPVYRAKLAGGDFPEGWQYGDLVGAIFAMYADAENTAHPGPPGAPPARSMTGDLPWLEEIPRYYAHAILPDGKHMYDTGDWSEKPAKSTPHALWTLSVVLPKESAAAKHARALGKQLRQETDEWPWLEALWDEPARPVEDPRAGATSYLSKGTATAIARTAWKEDATWFAASFAPSLSDHQHLDAGHFALVRGADQLLVDSSGYGSYSSMSHNTILVDDNKETLNYAPNQGTWSDTAHVERFEDAKDFVYVMGEYTSAYNPSGWPRDQPKRSVSRAERDIVFSRRSSTVVVYDRITVVKPEYGVTFVVHPGDKADVRGTTARANVGASSVAIASLLPGNAPLRSVKEPTNRGEGPFYDNTPPEGKTTFRLEAVSPTGSVERRFLHTFVAGPRVDPAVDKPGENAPARLEGDGAHGASIGDEVFVFPAGAAHPSPAAMWYRAPLGATQHAIVGLSHGGRYKVTLTKEAGKCRVALAPDGADRSASPQGVMSLNVADCALR
jgi:hypothetical protein